MSNMATQSDPFGDDYVAHEEEQKEHAPPEETPQAEEAPTGNVEHNATNSTYHRMSPTQEDGASPT